MMMKILRYKKNAEGFITSILDLAEYVLKK